MFLFSCYIQTFVLHANVLIRMENKMRISSIMTMRSLKAKLISMTKIYAATILGFKIEIFVTMFEQDKTKVLAHKWFVEQGVLEVYWVEFEIEGRY